MRGDINSRLTNREVEVLGLVAQGCTNEEVAGKLEIQLQTIRNHMVLIRLKLGAHNSPHAVAIAKDKGLI